MESFFGSQYLILQCVLRSEAAPRVRRSHVTIAEFDGSCNTSCTRTLEVERRPSLPQRVKKGREHTVAQPAKLPKAQSAPITCPKGVTGTVAADVSGTGTRKGAACPALRSNSSWLNSPLRTRDASRSRRREALFSRWALAVELFGRPRTATVLWSDGCDAARISGWSAGGVILDSG